MTKTIMIVDDEHRLVSLVQSYLVQEGFRVVTANNGKDALAVARHEKPDLIILDIMMPEMNGYDFMRQHRAERDTPIILLTARVDSGEATIGGSVALESIAAMLGATALRRRAADAVAGDVRAAGGLAPLLEATSVRLWQLLERAG